MVSRLLKLPKSKSFFLFGPRQTGKSTWVRALLAGVEEKATLVFDLLQSDEYMRLVAEPSLFRKQIQNQNQIGKISHVFVDEIQRIPELLNEIHSLMEGRVSPVFIMTGSSARKLKRDKANLLAGRAWSFKLFPLTHLELGEGFDLSKALERGTLPKIYLEEDPESANRFLRSYVETYLKEEIEAEALVRGSGTFLRFLFQAGHESGNIINYSAIARDCNTTSVTVKEYFKILEDTLIGSFLFPFRKSRRQRLAQHPKFYLFDTGVQRALVKKLSVPIEPRSPDFGNAFESWVINESMRLSAYFERDYEFSFYRTEKGAEVDLIIETPRGQCVAVEIKSSDAPSPVDFSSGFQSFSTAISRSAIKICVCTTPRPYMENDIEILGWREFFLRLKDGF